MEWPLVGRVPELQRLQQVLAGSGPGGMVVFGDAGLGKTRLVREALTLAERLRRPTELVVATRSAESIPFGALAHLIPLPAPGLDDRLRYLQQAMAALSARGTEHRPLVLAIDDGHLLGEPSASLVHHLARSRNIVLLLTCRRGEPAPDAVVALWRDGVLGRSVLAPLGRTATERLLERALEGRVARTTHEEIWRLTRGNPLFLRELVLSAQEAGTLVRDEGRWTHTGPLRPSERLTDIIWQRFNRLDRRERDVLDLLAVGEPLSLDGVDRIGELAVAETLERHALVTIDLRPGGGDVRLAHPLYGEVLRAQMPKARRRRLAGRLTEVLARPEDPDRPADVLRLATWRLEAGDRGDSALFASAAQQAERSFDHALAERLARAAVGAGGGFEARLALGEALAGQGRGSDASRELRRAMKLAANDEERSRGALALAREHFFLEHRTRQAIDLLRRASDEVRDPSWRDRLDAQLALFVGMLGDLPQAIALGRRIKVRTDAGPAARIGTFVTSTVALDMMGRFGEATQDIDLGLALVHEGDEPIPFATDLLLMNRVFALAYTDRAPDAVELGRSEYRRSLDEHSDIAGVWCTVLAEALLIRGHVQEAARVLGEAIELLERADPMYRMAMARGFAAVVSSYLGDAVVARHQLIDQPTPAHDPGSRIVIQRAHAWLLAASGDLVAAAEAAAAAGRAAVAEHHLVWGAFLLHDAVRYGHADLVVADLGPVADLVEGVLVPTLAQHAAGLSAGNASTVEAASRTLERIGALLYAAEAAAHAAMIHQRQGELRSAQLQMVRASTLTRQCRGARTPPLHELDRPLLTERQTEVAQLAGEGLSSRQIAERLVVSVRTVDNHLAAVYGKLDVHDRRELRSLTGETTHPFSSSG